MIVRVFVVFSENMYDGDDANAHLLVKFSAVGSSIVLELVEL